MPLRPHRRLAPRVDERGGGVAPQILTGGVGLRAQPGQNGQVFRVRGHDHLVHAGVHFPAGHGLELLGELPQVVPARDPDGEALALTGPGAQAAGDVGTEVAGDEPQVVVRRGQDGARLDVLAEVAARGGQQVGAEGADLREGAARQAGTDGEHLQQHERAFQEHLARGVQRTQPLVRAEPGRDHRRTVEVRVRGLLLQRGAGADRVHPAPLGVVVDHLLRLVARVEAGTPLRVRERELRVRRGDAHLVVPVVRLVRPLHPGGAVEVAGHQALLGLHHFRLGTRVVPADQSHLPGLPGAAALGQHLLGELVIGVGLAHGQVGREVHRGGADVVALVGRGRGVEGHGGLRGLSCRHKKPKRVGWPNLTCDYTK